jgi:1-acyl-sn-glycerol-3-phosphate acyltransferase
VHWALRLFCRNIVVQHKALAATKGPLLITANHPNSFLDAIIIAALFEHPVHFLARGDAFTKPWHRTVLSWLQMIPIYRLSEGKDKLHLNDYAFDCSHQILAAGGIVLIFIEGICVHQHVLQPFKKGAARIAWRCHIHQIPLRIMPVGLAYSGFTVFAPSVSVQLSPPLQLSTLIIPTDEVKSRHQFNAILLQRLSALIQIPIQNKLNASIILRLLGALGWLIHQPLYIPIQQYVATKTTGTVFYHSVLFGVLLLLYPLYLLLLFGVLQFTPLLQWHNLLVVAAHPFLAWCATRYFKK